MRAFTVSWNPNKDETKISLSPEFKAADWVTKADILQDALHDIEELYNKTLQEFK